MEKHVLISLSVLSDCPTLSAHQPQHYCFLLNTEILKMFNKAIFVLKETSDKLLLFRKPYFEIIVLVSSCGLEFTEAGECMSLTYSRQQCPCSCKRRPPSPTDSSTVF